MVLVILDASMRILLLLRDASEQPRPYSVYQLELITVCPIERFLSPFRGCLPPTGRTYVRQRGFLPTISTSHYGTHSIAPLNPPLSLPLLTVYMEMRLSLQKLLFANILPYISAATEQP